MPARSRGLAAVHVRAGGPPKKKRAAEENPATPRRGGAQGVFLRNEIVQLFREESRHALNSGLIFFPRRRVAPAQPAFPFGSEGPAGRETQANFFDQPYRQ